jgi:hypothetical protein
LQSIGQDDISVLLTVFYPLIEPLFIKHDIASIVCFELCLEGDLHGDVLSILLADYSSDYRPSLLS